MAAMACREHMIGPLPRASEMSAFSGRGGKGMARDGGGHAVAALGRGAGDADQGSAVAGDEQGVQLASRGGDPGDHAARAEAAAAAMGAVWLPGACGPTSWPTVATADTCGRDRADSAAVPGALSGLQREALLRDGASGARSEAVVHVRETDPAGGWSGEEASREGASSEEAREEAAVWSDAASGWQSSPMAGAGPWGEADADPGGGRCDVAGAVRAAVAWRDGAGGDDGDVRGGARARHPGVVLHGPCGMGFRDSRGRGQGEQDAADPGGRSAETTRRRAHPVLLAPGTGSLGADESHGAGSARQRAESSGHHDGGSSQSLSL